MTATRQQRGVELAVLSVRILPDLIEWLRQYARSEGISVNMAAARAILAFKDQHS